MQVNYVDHSGGDLLVVNAARCSFGKEKSVFDEKDDKLVKFLAREKHLLPFRHPTLTLRCKAPLFVARQLGKHQAGMSWSEESRRYISTEPEFFWPDKWRKRAENVKQGSSDEEVDVMQGLATDSYFPVRQVMEAQLKAAVNTYNDALEAGIAPELARMILPQNMYITWVWTGTLLAWIHMIKERANSHAQRETQDFARMVEAEVRRLYPVSASALLDNPA